MSINSNIVKNKINVALITGGWSGEREISLRSSKSMIEALEKSERYNVTVIDYKKDIFDFAKKLTESKADVALLAIHGVGAEDGVLQGILETANIPYTSSGVTASSISMDKVFSKIIFEKIGIKVPKWELLKIENAKKGISGFNFPYVIKPRNEGSSLGVYIIHNQNELDIALSNWSFGDEVLVEEYIKGAEVQVAVICGKAIGAIEIIPHSEFFDYKAKYTTGGADHVMPADIPEKIYNDVLTKSESVYKFLNCKSVVRIDFLIDKNGTAYILEVNTQPGMTSLSLVPEIAAYCGISYEKIIDIMIESAMEG